MDTDTLKQILENHAAWLRGDNDKSRANLGGAYLRGTDLSNADLRNADLRNANLSGAYLSNANLGGAYLRGTDLSNADLRNADLRNANLSGAYLSNANLGGAYLRDANLSGTDLSNANLGGTDLSNADLRNADLRNANLSGAYLSNANLGGASLGGTCLSSGLTQLARKFAKECPSLRTGGRIVYRTAVSQFVGSTSYQPGRTYIAPVLSWSVETKCHPGIYAGSLRWIKNEFPHSLLVRCYVRDGDWTITAKGAIRCSRIRVLGYVTE